MLPVGPPMCVLVVLSKVGHTDELVVAKERFMCGGSHFARLSPPFIFLPTIWSRHL